jgi:diadenosine tetraphosphate (Ap4A) HIT family hydrolase
MLATDPNCVFCNIHGDCWREKIYETENFLIRVGVGIITPGDCMIVTKAHYSCMGELPKELIPEYLDLKEKISKKLTEKISAPFSTELGVFAQTVFHAHTHFFPSSSEEYSKVDIINEFILPSIRKLQIPFEKTDMYGLREIYKQEGQYISFEQNNEMYVLKTKGFKKEEIDDYISYRAFFVNQRNVGVRHWKTMTEQEKAIDKIKVEKSKEILDF